MARGSYDTGRGVAEANAGLAVYLRSGEPFLIYALEVPNHS
jgi:hypothetical protein